MSLPKPMRPFPKSLGFVLFDLPDVEIDKAYREHVVGEKDKLVFPVLAVRCVGIPQKCHIFMLLRRLEGKWQVVAEFGGFFHGSRFRGGGFFFAPDAGEGGLNFFLEASDQFAVGGDQRLLGFDLGDDGLLGGDVRKR